MADFLAVLSSPGREPVGDATFTRGLAFAKELQGQQPVSIARGSGFRAAGFARRDGTGGRVAVDPATGCWALAAGTWFHARGFSSGREPHLIARWLEAGIETVARELDGFFVVVLGDPRTGEAFVITDAVGTHFAFLRSDPDSAVIGGSSLVLAGLGAEEPDPVGVQELLRTGSSYEGRTAHRRVTRLLGGRVYTFRGSDLVRTLAYWSPADPPRDQLEGAAAVDALHAVIGQSAQRIAALDSRILSDLTGGYDSRALLSGFLGAGIRPATTVSGTPDSADVRTAAIVAKAAGLDHRHEPARAATTFGDIQRALPFTDGEYDLVEYSSILSVQAASLGEYGVSVAGGAGEVARGRHWMYLMPHIGRPGPIDARWLVATRMKDSQSDPALFSDASRLDIHGHYLGLVARTTEKLTGFPNTLQCDATYLGLRMSAWQGRIASSTDRLRRCVAPFLFRSVLDVMLSMTIGTRYRSRVIREMLARHRPELARIPMGRGYPPLPFGLRTAHAFWPLPVYYAKRLAAKAARAAGVSLTLAPTAGHREGSRVALWRDEAVRNHLDPHSMRLAPLLAGERLESFLADSRAADFAFDGAWNRLLTLEVAFRRIEQARLKLSRGHGAQPVRPQNWLGEGSG